MKVSFYLHNQLDSAGRAAIYCRYSHDSEEYRFPVKYDNDGGVIRIAPGAWIKGYSDLKKQIKARTATRKDSAFRVKKDYVLSVSINARLDNIEKEIYSICNDLLLSGKTPFVYEVKSMHKELNQKIDIFSLFDRFMLEKEKTSKAPTVRNFRVFEKILLLYSEENQIKINKLDHSFLLSFREFLSIRGNSISTIRVYVIRFKTFLSWAYKNDFIRNDKVKEWKVENQKALHTYLKPDEIQLLMNLNLSGREEYARNLLLFSCFTGMRAGEMNSLTALSERKGILTFETGKVKGQVKKFRKVKLNELSLPLWKYFLQHGINFDTNINKLIKEVARKAGINEMVITSSGEKEKWKDLSIKSGRITFITLAYQFEIPKNFIQIIVGHSRQSMTDHYDKTESEKSFSYLDYWAKCYLKAVS